MGGCAASRLGGGGEGDDDPVALCRERKRLLRAAVERRYALAAAHAAYTHSLNAVAAAIDVFVARHSAQTAILVDLPGAASGAPVPALPPCTTTTTAATTSCSSSPPSAFLRHTPSEAKTEALECPVSLRPSSPSTSSSEDGDAGAEAIRVAEVEHEERVGGGMEYGYFYSAAPTMPPSPSSDVFGWDFFNPFEGMQPPEVAVAMVGAFNRTSDEDLRLVREEEGIPELEEAEEYLEDPKPTQEGEKVVALGEEQKEHGEGREVTEAGGGGGEEKVLVVAEAQGSSRELLQALRDVEDHFIRASDSGKEVSRMLEANMVHLLSGLDEIKENSSKVIQAITWHRSPSSMSSLSSFYQSQLASSSSSSMWSENKSDLFDDCGGMESGSHSQTLARLYAWEKKLYEEVKAGDQTRQAYEKKCMQLRNQNAKGSGSRSVDKTKAAVRELHSRIWVALRAVESISERIQKLRDEELHPQVVELLQGLMRSWKIMLESHETQKQIMFEVNSFTCPSYGKHCNDSQRLATLILTAELRNWRTCFAGYISAQKAYVEALDGWLSKFILPDMEYYSRSRTSRPCIGNGPPVVVVCREWSNSLAKLPDGAVCRGMRNFIRTARFLWVKQGEEQHQKKKVDGLTKELDRRNAAFQKAENKILDLKLSDNSNSEPDASCHRAEYLENRKELLGMFRKKLEIEKAKHRDRMRDTHEVTLNGFKIGLAGIFESLTEFCKDSLKLYNDLLMCNDRAKAAIEGPEKPCFTQDSCCSEEEEVSNT